MDANTSMLVFFGLLAVPLIGVAVCALRSREGLSYWALTVVGRTYFPLLYRLRTNRRCPFPEDRPALVIANHRSPVDPILIWCFNHIGPHGRRPSRRIEFLTAREYLNVPVVGWICRTMRVIPVGRDGRDMGPVREALSRLKQEGGCWIGLFPEGRINLGTDLLPGNEGVAWLAIKAQVPVYPVFIEGAPQGDSMIAPFLTPANVTVHYGDPIDLSQYAGKRPNHRLLSEVTDLLMSRIAELGGVSFTPLSEAPQAGAPPLSDAAAPPSSHTDTPTTEADDDAAATASSPVPAASKPDSAAETHAAPAPQSNTAPTSPSAITESPDPPQTARPNANGANTHGNNPNTGGNSANADRHDSNSSGNGSHADRDDSNSGGSAAEAGPHHD